MPPTTTKQKQLSSPSSRRQVPLGWTSKQESPPDHGDKNNASSANPSIMQMHAMQKESTELKLPPDDKDELKSYQRRKSSVVTSQQQQCKASSSVPKRQVQITVPSQKQKQFEKKRNNSPPKEASTKFAQLPTRQQKSLAEQRRRVARNQTPITLMEVTMNEKEKNESKSLLTCFLSRMDNNEKPNPNHSEGGVSSRKRGACYDGTTTTSIYVDRYQHNSNNYGAPYHYTAVPLYKKKAKDNDK